jgi:xanthine dehydrogenase iron-sulfur cluster and FAD-binding subunit A
VEYPAVPLGQSRFRFQVMAAHTDEDIKRVVAAFNAAMEAGEAEVQIGGSAPNGPSLEADVGL